jgi:multiple sugar transport system ATP-binding protein
MATVKLESIGKAYRGGVDAVRDVNLEIADGEFLTLVGPSGCGKSTTLNLIAGLETPTSGLIRIDGEVVNTRSPRERDVAMVFQSYALYPHKTVRRNLAFPLEVAGLPAREISEQLEKTAELLELHALLDRLPRELSGGQRQRVALGRALVRRPKLFLFDEPLSNLDAALRTQMRSELKKLHQRLKATFIYVTHDQAEAMTLSDRVVVMNAGTIQQVGPPREIYDAPLSAFVATFFGSPRINLLPPELLGLPMSAGGKVGIRPEHVSLGTGAAPADARMGQVDLVEPMGPENWVTVRLGSERVIARTPPEFHPVADEEVWVRFDPVHLRSFSTPSSRSRT